MSASQSPSAGTGAGTAPRPQLADAPSADPWRRLMGIAYEAIILFGVIWFADYVFSALTQFRGEPGPMRYAFQSFTLAVLGVYFVGFWSDGRRSLPMKTMSLQLSSHDGSPVGRARALARFAAATAMWLGALAAGHYLSGWLYLLFLVPFGWTLFDPQRRALYDVIAGTRLVVLAPDARLRSVDV
ncbi:MAG: RDD family protein [Limnobacter sp.]|nr:RDD family protein [Limnobacter sp.]